jgi:pyruvate dehydrogenase E1 component
LRDFFEVDCRYIAIAALRQLAASGEIEPGTVARAIKELDIQSGKLNPHND